MQVRLKSPPKTSKIQKVELQGVVGLNFLCTYLCLHLIFYMVQKNYQIIKERESNKKSRKILYNYFTFY